MKELFVVRHDEGWAVTRRAAEPSAAVAATQAEAIHRAREMEPSATIHVQKRHGEFRRLTAVSRSPREQTSHRRP